MNEKINDGGPAFPGQQDMCPDGKWNQTWEPDMSLRAYAAIQVTPEIIRMTHETFMLASQSGSKEALVKAGAAFDKQQIVASAVEFADALIAELEKPRC